MHPDSESLLARILNPAPMAEEAVPEPASSPVTLQQIVAPEAPPAPYAGPERRARGYLVAEILPDSPPVDGQAPEFDPPR